MLQARTYVHCYTETYNIKLGLDRKESARQL